MESPEAPPPTSVLIDFTLADDSDSDFYAVFEMFSSDSDDDADLDADLVPVHGPLLPVSSDSDDDSDLLPVHGPLLPPPGDGDAAAGPPPSSDQSDAVSHSVSSGVNSFEYLTTDSLAGSDATEMESPMPMTPHTVRPRRPRPERRCKACVRVGECSVCGCEFRTYRRR